MYGREFYDWRGIDPWFWPRMARELPPRKKTPFLKTRRKGGRPRADDRKAMSAIFWRLRCGGDWSRLPPEFGPALLAKRCMREWLMHGRLERAWRAYLYQQSRGELERWQRCMSLSRFRETQFWRSGLDAVWRIEFEPLIIPKEYDHTPPKGAPLDF